MKLYEVRFDILMSKNKMPKSIDDIQKILEMLNIPEDVRIANIKIYDRSDQEGRKQYAKIKGMKSNV